MKPFRLTLRSGLIALLAIFAVLIGLIGGGSYIAMKQAQAAFSSVYHLNVERLGTARAIYADLMQTRVLLDSYQTDYNRLKVKAAKVTWAKAETTFARARETLDTLAPGHNDVDLKARFQALVDDGIQPGFKALKAWNLSAYQESVKHTNTLTDELDQALDALNQAGATNASQSLTAMQRNVDALELGLGVAAIITLALLALAFYSVNRHLLHPLSRVRSHLTGIAAGDLAQRLATSGMREMSQLKQGVAKMQASLTALVAQLQQESHALSADARRLSQASHALNDESQQQAQALQETSSSMEQITAAIGHTAEHSERGRNLADESRRHLDHSGQQMATAVNEMEAAQARSQASLEVIAMIDSLAYQTSMLALNASVEAARAGNHGRGFAVVAAEVKNLASRSSEAAKTIREQIEGTHQQVQQGADVLTQAGQSLHTAVDSSRQLSELLDSITTACQQQHEGIAQIDQAIASIDSATQRNVELAAQTLDATRDLEARAQRQRDSVEAFRLGAGETPDAGPERETAVEFDGEAEMSQRTPANDPSADAHAARPAARQAHERHLEALSV
ncbi:HAMP domain-containing protein [Salinicola endophyticus]|uniref:HAMP domain-containing protein n=1 Tax=Salinicola endophyticus TaxID=1949083 RepID=A0ABY8FGP4_9GAMM|nr:methyl-accepting chemotaxis protein [Salinicola endophyticus]WFF41983.1 HAMP domain-containing protein [Salinicola endophyticus]